MKVAILNTEKDLPKSPEGLGRAFTKDGKYHWRNKKGRWEKHQPEITEPIYETVKVKGEKDESVLTGESKVVTKENYPQDVWYDYRFETGEEGAMQGGVTEIVKNEKVTRRYHHAGENGDTVELFGFKK